MAEALDEEAFMGGETEKKVERARRFFVEQSMKAENPNRRRELLREFFLNASMIALVNELGAEMSRLEAALRQCGIDPEEFGIPERVPIPAA